MVRSIKLFISVFLLCSAAFAQEESTDIGTIETPILKATGNRLYGKVINKTGRGVEAASLQLYVVNSDSAGRKTDSLIRAKTSLANGDFEFNDLPPVDSFRLFISAVGFGNVNRYIVFSNRKPDNFVQRDLGNLQLTDDVQQLTGVTVTATRPAMQMGVDRRVFNVDRSLTATGGTAVDVMKNIPSLTVDMEGNVSLRNNTPQVFVDGRPTILTLDQIPADNIERVELITNPSAKFDAASTAGIINIILKKNKRVGLNGIASLGAGYPGILNGSINLNTRQGKINLFLSGNFNQSGGIAEGRTLRQNKQNGVYNYFNQYSDEDRRRKFASLRFGIDYFIDNRNTISLSQNLVKGKFDNNEEQDQQYLNASGMAERFGERTSSGSNEFNRYNTQLNFTHKFPESEKELTANINYNYGKGSNRSDIFNAFFNPDGTPYNTPTSVNNSGNNNNDQLTFQIDFTDPIGDKGKFETGLRSFINKQGSRFLAVAKTGGTETILPLSNNIEYHEIVHAAYINYANRLTPTFSYQAGLRFEYSSFDGKLLDSGDEFGYRLPVGFKGLFDALFPSLFLTKALNDKTDLQLNYSRRIRRPNFWQLNPFLNISDPVNVSIGNPGLRPEYTNSFELNVNRKYTKGDFLASLYYRNNQDDITRYSDTITAAQYQQLNNAAVDPNAILNTFINATATNRMGAEFVLQHRFSKNFDITPSVDLQYRKVIAGVDKLNLDNEGFNWEAKLIANYKIETQRSKLLNNLAFQLITEYESPEIIPQGRRIAQYSMDVALKKDFLKNNKASLTLSINDIFWTNRWGAVIDTEQFFQDSYRRNVRTFRLTFSYKFGNADFQLFRRNSERGDNEG